MDTKILRLTANSVNGFVEIHLQHDDYEALALFRYATRKFLRSSKTTLGGI